MPQKNFNILLQLVWASYIIILMIIFYSNKIIFSSLAKFLDLNFFYLKFLLKFF